MMQPLLAQDLVRLTTAKDIEDALHAVMRQHMLCHRLAAVARVSRA